MNFEWLPEPCTSLPVVSARPLDAEVTLVSSSHRPSVSALLCALVCHGALSWPVSREAFSVAFHPRHITSPSSPRHLSQRQNIIMFPRLKTCPHLLHYCTFPLLPAFPFNPHLPSSFPSSYPLFLSFRRLSDVSLFIPPPSHFLFFLSLPVAVVSLLQPSSPLTLPSPSLHPFPLFPFVSSIISCVPVYPSSVPPVIYPFSSRTRRVPPSIPCVTFAL